MAKAGVPQFNFESFKVVYDNTPQLQELVKFGPNGVKIYSDNTDKLPNSKPGGGEDRVAAMASRATSKDRQF
jgi:hypothetical protein